MAVLQGSAKSVADGGFYPTEIAQSLRFNDDDSAYLSRTPSVSGNRKTWTWSGWVKRGSFEFSGATLYGNNVFSASNGTTAAYIKFRETGCLAFHDYTGSGYRARYETYALFRDPSAWYHVVLSVDTTQAVSTDRVKIYVNGELQALQEYVAIAQNTDTYINEAITHMLGRDARTTIGIYVDPYDGYLAEVHFTDGTAYTANAFGEFKSGVWVAKTPSVTYGTNGFYLPFNLSGDLGADSAYTIHDIFGDSSAQATYLLDGNANDAGGNYNGTAYNVSYSAGIVGTQSADFNGSSSYISATPPSFLTSNFTVYSLSLWVRNSVYSSWTGSNSGRAISLSSVSQPAQQLDIMLRPDVINMNGYNVDASVTFSDSTLLGTSQWRHVYFEHVNGTHIKVYVDGVHKGTASVGTLTITPAFNIGRSASGLGYFNGDLDQVRMFNRALTEDEITQLASGYGLDESGIGNHWTPYNLQTTDVMLDSPTNNFATLSPIDELTRNTLSEGNLRQTSNATSSLGKASFYAPDTGKWYWETYLNASNGYDYIGFDGNTFQYNRLGTVTVDGSAATAVAGFATGDIVALAFDADANTVGIYKNGTLLYTASPSGTLSGLSIEWYINNTTYGSTINFGQDSSFAGTKTPQGYTDANGIGDFYYEPPTDYLALCTANLPEPSISPLNDVSPTDYMNTVLYTGNGTSQSISGTGFQSDLIWIKGRNAASAHSLQDSVRGFDEQLASHLTAAEITDTTEVTSVNADGFDVGNSTGAGYGVNISGRTYVAWNWLAGGTPVTNTDGTITSSVSANTESGFSIVSYTGNGFSSASVGHGLSQAPEMMILKDRGNAVNWYVWHNDGTTLRRLEGLNTTAAAVTSGLITSFNASTFDFSATTGDFNGSGKNYITYCFHGVEGFSKFGSYTGNGSADGTFVYLGFRPSYVMVKRTNAASDWIVWDVERDAYNVMDSKLSPNTSSAEYTGTAVYIDGLSNGFKLRNTDGSSNSSGDTYIYMAFAESGGPFKYSNAR